MLFDWFIIGQVLAINPAHAVRGPKHIVKRGKTAVLTEEKARRPLESIKVVKKIILSDGSEAEVPRLVGLRDRALIGVMVYTSISSVKASISPSGPANFPTRALKPGGWLLCATSSSRRQAISPDTAGRGHRRI
jgi:hypothetical protein